jgi:hypothetical protein
VLAVPRGALLLARVSNQGFSTAQEGLQEVRPLPLHKQVCKKLASEKREKCSIRKCKQFQLTVTAT